MFCFKFMDLSLQYWINSNIFFYFFRFNLSNRTEVFIIKAIKMTDFIARPANIDDCQAILKLIQELADYEKIPDGPKLNLES